MPETTDHTKNGTVSDSTIPYQKLITSKYI